MHATPLSASGIRNFIVGTICRYSGLAIDAAGYLKGPVAGRCIVSCSRLLGACLDLPCGLGLRDLCRMIVARSCGMLLGACLDMSCGLDLRGLCRLIVARSDLLAPLLPSPLAA
jgi:hypothetical protein